MSNGDTAVLVGWPIANVLAFRLQGPTPVPSRGQTSSDMADPPISMQPLPAQHVVPGIFPTSGAK